jgi:NAD(P)H dehydrogenase (quinone)
LDKKDLKMKHVVVVAHPAAESFTMALTRTYTAELEQLGHSQRTYDLYRMGFNPVLGAQELLPITTDRSASPDVMKAQDDIRAAAAVHLSALVAVDAGNDERICRSSLRAGLCL